VNHDAAALENGGIAQGRVVISGGLIVVDDGSVGRVPNLDAKPVLSATALDLTIDSGEEESTTDCPLMVPQPLN
jgi:hypothetical protein